MRLVVNIGQPGPFLRKVLDPIPYATWESEVVEAALEFYRREYLGSGQRPCPGGCKDAGCKMVRLLADVSFSKLVQQSESAAIENGKGESRG